MLTIDIRVRAFAELGKYLRDHAADHGLKEGNTLETMIRQSHIYNPWFSEENVRIALRAIAENLTAKNIDRWLKPYRSTLEKETSPKRIGTVMAGNIPLVGFHDFLTVLISGNTIIARLSSDDNKLLPLIAEKLIQIEPRFRERIIFTGDKLENFDAVIATGSNNTARYFEFYFGRYPHIIRKNRNGIAVLTGNETPQELKKLGKDIFLYYGMGCRSVSKLFVPKGYSLSRFIHAMEEYSHVKEFHKYGNNYDYYKSIYLINQVKHFDNGFLLVKEDSGYSSPPSVIYFEEYDNLKQLEDRFRADAGRIQCIIGKSGELKSAIPFGRSQFPELWDYADGVDTLSFLLKLNKV